ncbi:Mak16 protein [Ramicandelaber brevisporus]|nr:Mak16 protein [Ramicandelaber brevisporus]KAI8869699.1 Mak16 protein [Ramicandelaber brevisporus]
MAGDDLVWDIINRNFCSYKVKTETQNFCRNAYNVTGFCSRQSCPLANSRYATIRERKGVIYLFMKTPERAHSPAKLWEVLPLPKNYTQALQMIDKELIYWPGFMIHKCKQRLTKITQYLIRMRKLKTKAAAGNAPTITTIRKKHERRERSRETKAERAAKLNRSIERELLERLKNKAYGDAPLNVREDVWREILESEGLAANSDQSDYDGSEGEPTDDEEEEFETEDAEKELLENADAFISADDSDSEFDEDIEDYFDSEDDFGYRFSDDEGEGEDDSDAEDMDDADTDALGAAPSDDEGEVEDSDDESTAGSAKRRKRAGKGAKQQPPAKKQKEKEAEKPKQKKKQRHVQIEYETERVKQKQLA